MMPSILRSDFFPFEAHDLLGSSSIDLTLYIPITVLSTGVHTMANAFRMSIRRFATTAARAASAATEAPTPNAYGIRVSKAQGVVDQLTGGTLDVPQM
jgi:hypothetical protein